MKKIVFQRPAFLEDAFREEAMAHDDYNLYKA